jgi:hypothetical protein
MHGVDEIEGCSDSAFRVVLPRHRRPPQRHHGVADELLDRPAITFDDRTSRLEVA